LSGLVNVPVAGSIDPAREKLESCAKPGIMNSR